LPSGLGFEVECAALAKFAHFPLSPPQDVTEQATWSSSAAGVARPLGLAEFGGPIRQHFRIDAVGAARLIATVADVTSASGPRSVVQGISERVTTVTVAAPPPLTVGSPVALEALATLSPAVSGCPVRTLDFSLLTTGTAWRSADPHVATVDVSGVVTPLAAGQTRIDWSYSGPSLSLSGEVPITVAPAVP
jgi:hypothetical protein